MNRSGECDADRSGLRNLEMLELLANDFADGLRSGHLRGEDLQTRFSKFALLEVNRAALMPEPPMSTPNACAVSIIFDLSYQGT